MFRKADCAIITYHSLHQQQHHSYDATTKIWYSYFETLLLSSMTQLLSCVMSIIVGLFLVAFPTAMVRRCLWLPCCDIRDIYHTVHAWGSLCSWVSEPTIANYFRNRISEMIHSILRQGKQSTAYFWWCFLLCRVDSKMYSIDAAALWSIDILQHYCLISCVPPLVMIARTLKHPLQSACNHWISILNQIELWVNTQFRNARVQARVNDDIADHAYNACRPSGLHVVFAKSSTLWVWLNMHHHRATGTAKLVTISLDPWMQGWYSWPQFIQKCLMLLPIFDSASWALKHLQALKLLLQGVYTQ